MKKIIVLALVLTTIAGTAFSNPTDAINQKALASFSKTFLKAEDVKWEVRKDLYKATFRLNNQTMFAYFNAEGEQVALTRNIVTSQLPLSLSSELQKGYNEYWLTDLFEVVADSETAYYATIQNATHITTLKAETSGGWIVYKKEKRS